MREQTTMEDGWRNLLKIKLHSRFIGRRLGDHVKSGIYQFKFKNKDRSVEVFNVNMIEKTYEYVDYTKFKRGDSKVARRFVRHYLLEYIKVVFEELFNGNRVYIGNNLFVLSLHTIKKKYQRGEGLYVTRKLSIRYIPKYTTWKKRKVMFYIKLDKEFKKRARYLKNNIPYYTYNLKFIR